jgi:5'-3' exonuclease
VASPTLPPATPRELLLDTSSLLYRAFFALPQSLVGGDGQPINAVHGYLDMTAHLYREQRPGHLIHVFDHDWRPAPRVAAYAGYKAQRPPDPEALPPQFDLLRALLAALGETLAESPGWEADDAIGTRCAQAPPDAEVAIVTGDRDLLQLVRDDGPQVRVLFTVKGVKQLARFDAAAVQAAYGVPPERYVDFAILRGDPSDGLPGVKGVGEKTAQSLVARYASLDALLADLPSQPPKLAANLEAARAYIAAMREIVPVRRDVAVALDPGALDEARLAELGERHRLAGAIQRLRAARPAG